MVVNLEMSLSSVQETVTVQGSSPLVDVSSSRPSGVVSTKQMEEIPVNGRNFLDPDDPRAGQPGERGQQHGRGNAQQPRRLSAERRRPAAHLAGAAVPAEPAFSRDAIAEFELLTNRFDATQGRSIGAVLNVITKSGTNTLSGTASGYFRSDNFNAADHIQNRVLPYSNQQISGTFGGPIRRDRAHYFLSYEGEREPNVITSNSRWPSFNIAQPFTRTELKALARTDFQFSPQNRLSVRFSKTDALPYNQGGGALRHPSTTITYERRSLSTVATWTQILNNHAVNEVKGGYQDSRDEQDQLIADPINQAKYPSSLGGNRLPGFGFLGGYRIGSNGAVPSRFDGKTVPIRDQYTLTLQKGKGTHLLKTGGELLVNYVKAGSCNNCNGFFDVSGGPVPANVEALFPVWDDTTTWNTNALLPIVKSFAWQVGEIEQGLWRPDIAGWIQDDWTVSSKLTLNLGARYDVSINQFANETAVPPFLPGDRPADKSNFAPRFGFAFTPNAKTVIRGGAGILTPSPRATSARRSCRRSTSPKSSSLATAGPTS